MRRHPALIFLIPLEHRELNHPKEPKVIRVQQLVPVVVLLSQRHPELPAKFQSFALFAVETSQNYQIVFGWIYAFFHLRHRPRKIAF